MIKKDDLKRVVDILKSANMIQPNYTGNLVLHVNQGHIVSVKYEFTVHPAK